MLSDVAAHASALECDYINCNGEWVIEPRFGYASND
jgi:hypothetical protein